MKKVNANSKDFTENGLFAQRLKNFCIDLKCDSDYHYVQGITPIIKNNESLRKWSAVHFEYCSRPNKEGFTAAFHIENKEKYADLINFLHDAFVPGYKIQYEPNFSSKGVSYYVNITNVDSPSTLDNAMKIVRDFIEPLLVKYYDEKNSK